MKIKPSHSKEVDRNTKNKLDTDLEHKYNIQNEEIFKFRNTLKMNKYKRNDLKSFLLKNKQHRPRGVPAMLDMIAEILVCGALEKCSKCWFGRYYYDKNSYECQGNFRWTSCKNKETTPARKSWEIPEKISKDFHSYLSSIEKHIGDRIFIVSSEFKEDDNNNHLPVQTKTKRARKAQSVKIILESGSQVDPKSKLEKTTHIFEDNGAKYSETLIYSDIQNKKNAFYKIQLLENNDKSGYWVFRSWGRIGTKNQGNTKKEFKTSFEAIMEFEKLYLKFTGNEWSDNDTYKRPRKYLPVEIDFGVKEIIEEIIEPSKLEVPVQEFLRLITNINSMADILVELDIDIIKMPLGKISYNQLKLAACSLQDILKLILTGETDPQAYIEASNKFYFSIPHNVGFTHLPILTTEMQILQKIHMLKELEDIKINYEIVNFAQLDKRNRIDLIYEKINTEIKAISNETKDYNLIKKYIENTHGSSHNINLKIDKVFEINRHGEDQRYKPFNNFKNKKLLWHGSRLTNFAGIFTNGLMIAPPESYRSGDMFGNGVYFADVVTKSAQYCNAGSNGVGALLLCEVALGEFEEFDHSPHPSCITDLIQQNKSCKGLGKQIPNPTESEYENGVEIPLGRLMIDDNYTGELMYNEYIVYNVDQIQCKYLVLLEFHNKK